MKSLKPRYSRAPLGQGLKCLVHSFSSLILGVIGRLCSMIVALHVHILNTVNPRYNDNIVAIKMNLLLYRILNEQIDM